MPLAMRAPPKVASQQFITAVTWGLHYLQTSATALAFALLTLAFLVSRLEDESQAAKWKTWALCFGIHFLVAPYERITIFPINDRIEVIEKELVDRNDGEGGGNKIGKELVELLKKWQWRNFGRVGLPLLAGSIGLLQVSRCR